MGFLLVANLVFMIYSITEIFKTSGDIYKNMFAFFMLSVSVIGVFIVLDILENAK
jgi:hypothetical protein